MCACTPDKTRVELLKAPKGSRPGERVAPEDEVDAMASETASAAVINIKKEPNAWANCLPLLKTNERREAAFDGRRLMTSCGPCVSDTLTNASIS